LLVNPVGFLHVQVAEIQVSLVEFLVDDQ